MEKMEKAMMIQQESLLKLMWLLNKKLRKPKEWKSSWEQDEDEWKNQEDCEVDWSEWRGKMWPLDWFWTWGEGGREQGGEKQSKEKRRRQEQQPASELAAWEEPSEEGEE